MKRAKTSLGLGLVLFFSLVIIFLISCEGDGPSPGDSCKDLNAETCSSDNKYVLKCEETDTGLLRLFIDEECPVDWPCEKISSTNAACECDDDICDNES